MSDAFIGIKVSGFFDRTAVTRRMNPARRKYLASSGALVRSVAKRSIKKKGNARRPPKKYSAKTGRVTAAWRKWMAEIRERPSSPPGSPPFSHDGRLPKSILFAVGDESVVIGPDRQIIGEVGRVDEFGERFRGRRYPKRPFMAPALETIEPKLPGLWAKAFQQAP